MKPRTVSVSSTSSFSFLLRSLFSSKPPHRSPIFNKQQLSKKKRSCHTFYMEVLKGKSEIAKEIRRRCLPTREVRCSLRMMEMNRNLVVLVYSGLNLLTHMRDLFLSIFFFCESIVLHRDLFAGACCGVMPCCS
ncbi:unnamed protein product [Vicia faba]|uniref:Uncharacterized protein n=1 Tax=Vicia faba TaxID=3906 RepID=A0AAV0YBT6_VICFA|nr:unnamed protein product [Vicia faba]